MRSQRIGHDLATKKQQQQVDSEQNKNECGFFLKGYNFSKNYIKILEDFTKVS